jgi:beta-fructofuranosidase
LFLSKKHHELMLKKANESVDRIKDSVKSAPYRQKYHFMAPAYWINDPNGLIQYKGDYHLFYQHYPYKPQWGSMHWGHAISRDLVHWEHLPIALAPSEKYDEYERGGCFSGSAVDDKGILSLLYTATSYDGEGAVQAQALATSVDGIHFEKYEKNPVIQGPPPTGSADFRDPKVWRYENEWYMVVGSCRDGKGKALLYKSPDLRNWSYVNVLAESHGELGMMWECPDFFPLGEKYVLMFSPMNLGDRKTVYLVGDMDYKTGKFFWSSMGEIDWGFDYYAPQSLMDDKGRRIIIGWANEWNWMPWWRGYGPTAPAKWCGHMGLPRVIQLCSDGKLRFEPIEELASLRYDHHEWSEIMITANDKHVINAGDGISYEIIVDFDLTRSTATSFGLKLRCSKTEFSRLECDMASGELIFKRTSYDNRSEGMRRCPLESAGKEHIKLHIFVDSCSVEVFADQGRNVMSSNIYPSKESNGIELFSCNGDVRVQHLETWGISSSW